MKNKHRCNSSFSRTAGLVVVCWWIAVEDSLPPFRSPARIGRPHTNRLGADQQRVLHVHQGLRVVRLLREAHKSKAFAQPTLVQHHWNRSERLCTALKIGYVPKRWTLSPKWKFLHNCHTAFIENLDSIPQTLVKAPSPHNHSVQCINVALGKVQFGGTLFTTIKNVNPFQDSIMTGIYSCNGACICNLFDRAKSLISQQLQMVFLSQFMWHLVQNWDCKLHTQGDLFCFSVNQFFA